MPEKLITSVGSLVGLLIITTTGILIASRAGFVHDGWLMIAFAFGILISVQSSIRSLRLKVKALEEELHRVEP